MGIANGRTRGAIAVIAIGICGLFAASVGQAVAASPRTTTAERNAIGAAEEYISEQPFSKVGLFQQLSSSAGEGFTAAQANYALAHIKVNWYAEAVADAKQYLSQQHFSCTDLIQQLDSSAGDGFTVAQATYAAKKVGLC